MGAILDADWDELQALAALASVAEERVEVARSRFAVAGDRPGGPLTLVIGRAEGGIDLLFGKWLGSNALAALRDSHGQPLVVGKQVATVKPRHGHWPSLECDRFDNYNLVAVRAPSLTVNVAAQLASLGTFEQTVFVTRWSQPLPSNERDLLQSLSELAATARVLIVALPGEAPQPDEIAEVKQFVMHRLRASGFVGERGVEVGIWVTDGIRPYSVERIESFLAPRKEDIASGKEGAALATFSALLCEVAKSGRSANLKPPLPISADECQRIEVDFAGYLKILGESTHRRFETTSSASNEQVRAFVLDQIKGWKQPINAAGMWLKYVDAVRPGAVSGLLNVTAEATKLLSFEPAPSMPRYSPSRSIVRLPEKLRPVAHGIVAGAAVYGLLSVLLPIDLPARDVMAGVGMMIAAIGGFALGSRAASPEPSENTPKAGLYGTLRNWEEFQCALQRWLSVHMSASAESHTDRCRQLARRLEVSLNE